MWHLATFNANRLLRTALIASWLPLGALQLKAGGQDTTVLPYQPSALELRIPAAATVRPGNGARVLVRSPLGQQQVAQLLCHVDDQLIIVRPTGNLEMIARSAAQPTDQEISKCSRHELEHLLHEANIRDYKLEWEKPYLFVSSCSDPFLQYTKTIIKSMYPGVVRQLMAWDLDVSRPTAPLMVVATPNREAFDALGRLPPEVLAYYSPIANYVVLYEDQSLADAAPEFALKQAAYTIVHEGVHQLLANTGVQGRLSDWPQWISEGIPEYLAPLQVRSKVVRSGSAELPVRSVRWVTAGMVNDLRMYDLLKTSGGDGQLIRETIRAIELDARGYAVAWGLVHHLATNRPEDFVAYLKELSRHSHVGAVDPKSSTDAETLFVKYFGKDFRDLEKSVQAHLTSKKIMEKYRDPIAYQTHYLVQRIQKYGKAFTNEIVLTTSPAAAREWKEQQEKEFPDSRYYTFIFESRQKAELKLRRISSGGR